MQWSEMGKHAIGLTPWWVGPRLSRKPVDLYWQPISEVVTARVDEAFDGTAWLSGTGLDGVLVNLTREALVTFDPAVRISRSEGSAVVGLTVPDEVADSRDLVRVLEFVEAGAIEALNRVAKRLKRPLPARSAATGSSVPAADRIRVLGDEHAGDDVLALVAPHLAARGFVEAIAATSEECHGPAMRGWRAFRLPDRLADARDLVVAADFRAIDAPVTLGRLLIDRGNALVVLGKRLDGVASWADRLDPALRFTPLVAGRDGHHQWAAFGLTKPAPAAGGRQAQGGN
ncbi:hypothetical protein ACFYOT_35945 [Saccharothrix saharensis]|uniref:hypothetical protein n=1 Tax=Saccharothrix saharensis TaxID=571190 RepID=UPI0036AFA03B